jgi:arylsulfatase A-like enzyme
MNIILIIFDSLRKDCIGFHGEPPWGEVKTPNIDRFAKESVVIDRGYPESLPTLPARRALYTGKRVYPFREKFDLKGDFKGISPGWGPVPEEHPTLAELLREKGNYRTCLISDCYHMFKPSKNFWRGFDQWTFLRGKELDPYRSGPLPGRDEIKHWLPEEFQTEELSPGIQFNSSIPARTFNELLLVQSLINIKDRNNEEDYFSPKVMIESVRWLEQNRDSDRIFLTIDCWDPHEPWFVPEHYRKMYDTDSSREQVISIYNDVTGLDPKLIKRTRANYSGLVTMCDRWFGYLYDSIRNMGLLENSMIILTSDHGHSIGDSNYLGKRGYPSTPEVFDVPIMVRHPDYLFEGGKRSSIFAQHTDISAQILRTAGIKTAGPIHGKPFLEPACNDDVNFRDHVSIGWGATVTLLNDRWWLNCKVNGDEAFLYDLAEENPFARNVASENRSIAKELFEVCKADAGGSYPDYLLDLATREHAPGCSILA